MIDTSSKNIKLAVLFAVIGSLSSALMGVFVKLIGDSQSTDTIVFARFFVGLILFFPWFMTDKNLFVVKHKVQIVTRSIASLLSMTTLFYAIKFIPVTNALLLNNTFPLFLPILTLLFLSLKTPLKLWIAIIIGFIGVALVLHPNVARFNWASPIALLSGLLTAIATLQIRLMTADTSSQQIIFYMCMISTIISGALLPFSFHTPTPQQILLLLLVGLFGASYQLFITLALKYAIARVVSPIFFGSILYAGILEWWMWHKVPSAVEISGMVIVIVGAILTISMSNASAHKINEEPSKNG